MPQVFHPAANALARFSIFGAAFVVVALGWVWSEVIRSPYVTQVGVAREQPVQFSHQHHVGAVGLDCRYCHDSVETSPFAGIPPTERCLGCHRVIWADSPMLAPVRASAATGLPLSWVRVHDLPDFVYFDHSIHLAKGVGCTSCHGRVDRMPLSWREQTLHMEWCLDCHRHPERHVRPPGLVFATDWLPPPDQESRGRELVRRLAIHRATDCVACHR